MRKGTKAHQKQQENGYFENVEGLLNFTSDNGKYEGDLQLKNTYSNKPHGHTIFVNRVTTPHVQTTKNYTKNQKFNLI